MMFTISPLLALVAFITVPVSIFGMRYVGAAGPAALHGAVAEHRRAQRPDRGDLHRPRRREGVRPPARGRGAVPPTNDELYESSFGAQFMSSLMQPMTMFLGNVQYVLVAVVGGLRVSSGAISVGRRAGVHPVLAAVLDAADAAGVDDERLPVRHRLARTGPRAARRRGAEPGSAGSHRRAAGAGAGRVPRRHVLLRADPPAHRGRSTSWPSRARPSPSSGRPVPARRPSSTC